MGDLATLVGQARKRLKLTYRDVQDAAAAEGVQLTHSTVHRIEKGDRPSASEATLRGLHVALKIPMRDLRAATGTTSRIPSQPFTLPSDADRLDVRERKLVRELVEVLLRARAVT